MPLLPATWVMFVAVGLQHAGFGMARLHARRYKLF
jgi:hypothetical protein